MGSYFKNDKLYTGRVEAELTGRNVVYNNEVDLNEVLPAGAAKSFLINADESTRVTLAQRLASDGSVTIREVTTSNNTITGTNVSQKNLKSVTDSYLDISYQPTAPVSVIQIVNGGSTDLTLRYHKLTTWRR